MESEKKPSAYNADLTENLHPVWHQARRIAQNLTLLFPKFSKPRTTTPKIDDTILERLSPEARERYIKSLDIK